MNKEIAQEKLNRTIQSHSIGMLCELFESTNEQAMTAELGIVRGAIMDELETRDSAKFELWVDCTTEECNYPSRFFL